MAFNFKYFFQTLLSSFYYLLYVIIFFLIIEILFRVIIFFPTNIEVFKYGFKKNIIFDIVDLSKFQIHVTDKSKKISEKKVSNENVWIFGGSTTQGYGCKGAFSSSWPSELSKINNNFFYKNFSFGGATSDQLINLLYQNLKSGSPDVVMWSSKFNTEYIYGATDYRNKNILKYDFPHSRKTNFFLNIKRIDKTLKSYLISYSFLDKIFTRVMSILYNKGPINLSNIEINNLDIEYSIKNFELNLIETIEISKKNDVKEFYIISLPSKYDLFKKKILRFELYEKSIKEIENEFYPYVKIIDLTFKKKIDDIDTLFCDDIHQTLKMNQIIANRINKKINLFSRILN